MKKKKKTTIRRFTLLLSLVIIQVSLGASVESRAMGLEESVARNSKEESPKKLIKNRKKSSDSYFVANDPLWLISQVPNIEVGTLIFDKFEIALSVGANSSVTVTEIHSKYYFDTAMMWQGLFGEISFSNRDFKPNLVDDYLTRYNEFNAQHTAFLIGYKHNFPATGVYFSAALGIEHVESDVKKNNGNRSVTTSYGKYMQGGSFEAFLIDFSIGYSF